MVTKERAYTLLRDNTLKELDSALSPYRHNMNPAPLIKSIAESGKTNDKLMASGIAFSDAVCDAVLNPESQFYKDKLERASRNLQMRVNKVLSNGLAPGGEKMLALGAAISAAFGESLDPKEYDFITKLEQRKRKAFEALVPHIDLNKTSISPESINPQVTQPYIDMIKSFSRAPVLSEANIRIIGLRHKQGRRGMIDSDKLEADGKAGQSDDPILDAVIRFSDIAITDSFKPSGSSTVEVLAARKTLRDVIEGQYKAAGMEYSDDILDRTLDHIEQTARKMALPPEPKRRNVGPGAS